MGFRNGREAEGSMSGRTKWGLLGWPCHLSLQTGCFWKWTGTLTRRGAGITGIKQNCPGQPGHLVTRVWAGRGPKSWSVCTCIPSAGGCCMQRVAGPGGVPLSTPGPFRVFPYSSPDKTCSFLLESMFILISQPGILSPHRATYHHILLGLSQNVFCGSGPRNLPFPPAPIPTPWTRAFALGCKCWW